MYFEDESKIKGNDIDVFSSEEFRRRRCKSVEFELASCGYERHIRIILNDPVSWRNESFVEVRSTDKLWYESMLKRMENVIDEIENQAKFMRHPHILSTLISVTEAIIFAAVYPNLLSARAALYGYFLFASIAFILFSSLNSFLFNRLQKAFPSVEFAFGPTHNNTALKQRRTISIIIPFILDILLFILGLLL